MVDEVPPGELKAPGLNKTTTTTTSGSKISHFSRLPTKQGHLDKPILVLIHGFPQTSYEWRKIIPFLPASYPLFIPDVPGYGLSTHPPSSSSTLTHDKRTIGLTLLDALYTALGKPKTATPIILIGHDRGARIAHRLTLDYDHPSSSSSSTSAPSSIHTSLHERFALRGSVFIDTVPEPEQWASFAEPRNAVSTYHWPFLASPVAADMILAYGAGKWCRGAITAWAGKPEKVDTENALKHYAEMFEREESVRAGCADYQAGAGMDAERHSEDLKEGRKVKRPVLVVYSGEYLGKKFERVGGVRGVWERYVEDKGKLSAEAIGDGAGHFLSEEAPEETARLIVEFLAVKLKM